MANRKAKIKTIEVSKQRRLRNRMLRSQLHSQIRALDDAVKTGKAEEAQVELKKSLIRLDKNVTKGILHANTAARAKSRLCARVAKMA